MEFDCIFTVEQLQNGLPADKICERLKQADGEICSYKYDKPLDLTTAKFETMRVKELKKVLQDLGVSAGEIADFVDKSDYLRKLRAVLPKDAVAAWDARIEAKKAAASDDDEL